MVHTTAKRYYSGFNLAFEAFNAITYASDGKIYYILSSKSINTGGRMYTYDPATDKTEFLADLTELCGEKKSIPQGKSHTEFYERNKKLYFSTHLSYYENIDAMERLPVTAPEGFNLYPGGHIFSYDIVGENFRDLAIVPGGEGIITMTMDEKRGHVYAITWPNGNFIDYDVEKDELTNIGPISGSGENGIPGYDFRVLCRCMFVDPKDGSVFFSTAEGDIFSYEPHSGTIKIVNGVSLKLDYFGMYDITRPGTMAYNWRKIIWHPTEEVAYGVHGNSGYLFRFNPRTPKIDLIDRITSVPSKMSGKFDRFGNGYLGFQLGPDNETLYYLTGGPSGNGVQLLPGESENLHLITYHLPGQKYVDHGAVFYGDGTRPTHVNSIAIDAEGDIYTLARFSQDGKIIQDLVKIPNPF